MRVIYEVEDISTEGVDKLYTVKLKILESGDEVTLVVDVPPGMTLENMLKNILLSDDEVVFVESSES